jgi:hypothetical protein
VSCLGVGAQWRLWGVVTRVTHLGHGQHMQCPCCQPMPYKLAYRLPDNPAVLPRPDNIHLTVSSRRADC